MPRKLHLQFPPFVNGVARAMTYYLLHIEWEIEPDVTVLDSDADQRWLDLSVKFSQPLQQWLDEGQQAGDFTFEWLSTNIEE